MNNYVIKTKPSLQYVCSQFYSQHGLDTSKVYSVCCNTHGTVFAGCKHGLMYFDGERFIKISGITGDVNVVYAKNNTVFACCENTVYFVSDNKIYFSQQLEEPAIGICEDNSDGVFLATKSWLYKLCDSSFVKVTDIDYACSDAVSATGAGNVYIANKKGLMMLHGKRPRWGAMLRGLTKVPQSNILSLTSDKTGALWVGCEDGLHLYDGSSEWLSPDEFSFFPKCPITKTVLGEDGTVYIGTKIGMYIVSGQKTRYYGRGRYLRDNNVVDICVCKNGTEVWIASETALNRICFVPMLLSEKEAYYDALEKNYVREGFVTRRINMHNDDLTTGTVSITDNDGLWSALYLASQCYKYSVTKNEKARDNAKKTLNAILKLATLTGISGFPARAYRRPGEDKFGNGDPEWHLTEDEIGELEWKGETSSDELVGHYFAYSVYFDRCANAAEKERVKQVVCSITDHILQNGYTLCDVDSKPTTWAHFGPADLNHDDKWYWEKGINSLELLAFLIITYHMSGKKKYIDEYNKLIKQHHYALNVLCSKRYDAHTSHIDDLLGFYIFVPLLTYETDATLLRYYRLALRRHYEYEKIEHNPLFNFIFARFTGAHVSLDEAIEVLEEYPLHLSCDYVENSVRPDIEREEDASHFGGTEQAKYALPASERVTGYLCYNAFKLNGGKNTSCVISAASWLMAYWFGRDSGMIEE